MAALAIKVLLAVFACIVAVLGVSDLKTVKEDKSLGHPPWWRRITGFGLLKIACALVTLLLIAVNEYWSYEAINEAKKDADRKMENVQSKPQQAHVDILSDVNAIEQLSRTNDYLVTSLDNSLVRAGAARVSWEDMGNPLLSLRYANGESVIPKRDDIVEWSLSCELGRLPRLPRQAENAACSEAGYGRLMANDFQIRLDEKSGRRTFFGTGSTGGVMTYQSAAENLSCLATSEALKQAHCDLEIIVKREARWKFEELQSAQNNSANPTIPADAQDACRRFEALFGETCEQAIRQGPELGSLPKPP